MSVYTESFEGHEGSGSNPSDVDIQQMMVEKAHELFKICDTEEKGFVTKRDMQRLQAELPLSPDQLESVFDSLDDDGNGYLTLEEFTDGFGTYFCNTYLLLGSELQIRGSIEDNSKKFSLFLNKNICCDPLLEPSP